MTIEKKFSRFLTVALVLLVGASLALVMGILYGILSGSMTQEFYQRLKAQQAETGMILQDRFNLLESRLREISTDNGVRSSLMTGARGRLLETMEAQYPPSNGALFIILFKENLVFVPELPDYYKRLEAYLLSLNGRDRQERILFKNFGDDEFLTFHSMPIKGEAEGLGTAYLLYNISRDSSA